MQCIYSTVATAAAWDINFGSQADGLPHERHRIDVDHEAVAQSHYGRRISMLSFDVPATPKHDCSGFT